jgi:lysophospholipase L1-like esterase
MAASVSKGDRYSSVFVLGWFRISRLFPRQTGTTRYDRVGSRIEDVAFQPAIVDRLIDILNRLIPKQPMYRFQISARTQTGESIGLVGSTPELGQWDVTQCIPLQTSAESYPLWQTVTDVSLPSAIAPTDNAGTPTADSARVDYKYVRLSAHGSAQWESGSANRWIPIAPDDPARTIPARTIVVDDGAFDYWQPYAFGYPLEGSDPAPSPASESTGLKVLVIGSSVARGQKAWMLEGWAGLLAATLGQKYGHQCVNVSEVGANVSRTIARFPAVVAPEQPDVVIISLSLGNEGLSSCPPYERRAVQRRFESGLQQLVRMTRALGALPILGAVYPHGDYTPEHHWLLQDTHNRMVNWGIPLLNWFAPLNNGQGRWKSGTSFDPAHPNTLGHRLMYEAIDLTHFQISQTDLALERQRFQQPSQALIYLDDAGFKITVCPEEKHLWIRNASPHPYTIAPYWQELQAALQVQARLLPGLYIAQAALPGMLPFFAVQEDGRIETTIEIPPGANLEYSAAFNFFSPHNAQLLFYDGQLSILKEGEHSLRIINEANHEYNIQPMWREVRRALKAMPSGVYEDPLDPDAPFRTLMIGPEGVESRVKAPPRSAMVLKYKCPLSDISRVAILPLGDRCAVRMMLYKMEYDGPAFPFDLTRTTQIGDIADMIQSRFSDMWNPDCLHYSAEAGRIYHSKWTGLSFAHEIEETDDPDRYMAPIYERMRARYSARSERFWYALQHCDKVLFVRTGLADRGGVIDLIDKLKIQCGEKPFHLLLLSPQSSDRFADLSHVLHYDLEFNPDRMYEDLGHWMYCTNRLRSILDALGVSSKNLFWCPPTPPSPVPEPPIS